MLVLLFTQVHRLCFLNGHRLLVQTAFRSSRISGTTHVPHLSSLQGPTVRKLGETTCLRRSLRASTATSRERSRKEPTPTRSFFPPRENSRRSTDARATPSGARSPCWLTMPTCSRCTAGGCGSSGSERHTAPRARSRASSPLASMHGETAWFPAHTSSRLNALPAAPGSRVVRASPRASSWCAWCACARWTTSHAKSITTISWPPRFLASLPSRRRSPSTAISRMT